MSNLVVLAHVGRFIERVLRRCTVAGLSAFFCFVSSQAFAQFEQHDIAGIKVGMSLSATKAAIAKVNPKYVITEIKGSGGNVIALQAIVGFDYDRTDDEFFAALNETGVTWFIGRWQKPADPMPKETLSDALTKKYGQLSKAGYFIWSFDRQGKQVSLENCGNQETSGYGISGVRTHLAPPSRFSSVCGGIISASFRSENRYFNDKPVNVVTEFNVQIAEVKSQYDKASGSAEAAAKEKQLREEKAREELLKKAKPPTL